MKRIVFILVLLMVVICTGCAYAQENDNSFDEEWIVGKSRAEIEEKYGELDGFFDDGNTICGVYVISEDTRDFWGFVEYGSRLKIYFNKEGKAVSAFEESNGTGG